MLQGVHTSSLGKYMLMTVCGKRSTCCVQSMALGKHLLCAVMNVGSTMDKRDVLANATWMYLLALVRLTTHTDPCLQLRMLTGLTTMLIQDEECW